MTTRGLIINIFDVIDILQKKKLIKKFAVIAMFWNERNIRMLSADTIFYVEIVTSNFLKNMTTDQWDHDSSPCWDGSTILHFQKCEKKKQTYKTQNNEYKRPRFVMNHPKEN